MTIFPLQPASPSTYGNPKIERVAEKPQTGEVPKAKSLEVSASSLSTISATNAAGRVSVISESSTKVDITARGESDVNGGTRVTIGSVQQRSLTYAASGLTKYDAIGDAPSQKNAAADTILSFITNRLATDLADGASTEDMQSRLAAALEGFSQGYGEAKEQLLDSGFLTPDIEDLIKDTYQKVLSGIDALAEEYGLESPVQNESAVKVGDDTAELALPVSAPQANQGSLLLRNSEASASIEEIFSTFAQESVNAGENLKQLLKGTEINYELLESRNFNFSLKTQDGDDVIISASAIRAERGSADASSTSLSGASSSQFSFDVDGELDEDELKAISDLLSQIGELSTAFFSGDIEQAFELALNVGFDGSEIAGFSLNLEQQVSTKIQATYAPADSKGETSAAQPSINDLMSFAGGNNSLTRLAGFVEMLQDVVYKAEAIGFDKSVISEFAGYLADTAFAEKAGKQNLQSTLDNLMSQA